MLSVLEIFDLHLIQKIGHLIEKTSSFKRHNKQKTKAVF